MVPFVLGIIHNPPYEGAHAGAKKFLAKLQEACYWPTMAQDTDRYARTCNTCQKTKIDRSGLEGGLRPAHIPAQPFATVSLDLITGLPPSGVANYTAVMVIVDKLTKYALFIPTHNELSAKDFAHTFVERVIHVYGPPERIIADCDPCWVSAFWQSVVQQYGAFMTLSLSHHPQTDGQTEVLNTTLEQMLRAYVKGDESSWAIWLGSLAFAYNSSVHSLTKERPDELLMGYRPGITSNLFTTEENPALHSFLPSQKGEDFIEQLELH